MQIPQQESRPEPLAEALVRTLENERDILEQLDDDFRLQREAIQRRDFKSIEDATERTNDHVAKLEALRKTRQRQAKLLARVLQIPAEDVRVAHLTERLGGHLPLSTRLEALRDEIRTKADAAQEKIDEISFMLQHSLSIGRDMLQTMHGVEAPHPGGAYDATGRSAGAARSNMVNRLG